MSPQTQTRTVGSGFTTFNYQSVPIAWLEGFDDTGQALDPNRPEPITPLGDKWPREFATSRVMSGGGLTMVIRELWNQPVWQTIPGLAQARNMSEVQDALAAQATSISAQ